MAAGRGPKAEQSLKGEGTLQERWRGVTKKLTTTSSLLRILPSEETKTGRGLERLEREKEKPGCFCYFWQFRRSDIAFM